MKLIKISSSGNNKVTSLMLNFNGPSLYVYYGSVDLPLLHVYYVFYTTTPVMQVMRLQQQRRFQKINGRCNALPAYLLSSST